MKKVIGVIGTMASGKDTFADILSEELKLPVYGISSILKEWMIENNVELKRENFTASSKKVADLFGEDYMAVKCLEKIKEYGIISGMRQIKQIEYLKNKSDILLVAVNADAKIRFERSKERGRVGDSTTFDEFLKTDNLENEGVGAMNINLCLEEAQINIENNGTYEELVDKAKKLIEDHNL